MTLLNTAAAIYFGTQPADAVYLGAQKVWGPPEEPGGEFTPTFVVSTSYGYTGASGNGDGMRDGLYHDSATVWAGASDLGTDYIIADLGSDVAVATIGVAPIPGAFDGWGAGFTHLAPVDVAVAAAPTSWTRLGTLNVPTEAEHPFVIGSTCRYIRIHAAPEAGWFALGDFRVYPA